MSNDDWLYGDDDWSGSIDHVIYQEGGGLPDCVVDEGTRCLVCPFGDWHTCPVLGDPDVRSYLRWRGERTIEYYREREQKIKRLLRILRIHKLPLHWEIIARIAQDETPDLFDSPNTVRSLLFFNQDVFQHNGGGVFELREG